MNEFQYLHSFQRLVRDGKLHGLTCTCGTGLAIMKNKGGDPVLWCPTCDSYQVPGLHLMDNVRRGVDFYVSQGYFETK